MDRPSWYYYALNIAEAAARRSEDPYVAVGAVVLRPDNSVAGVGYNGPPSGVEVDWTNRDERRVLMIHAEVNALRYCTRGEVAGGLVAVTGTPCPACLTVIASYAIREVYYLDDLENYDPLISETVAGRLGINLHHVRASRRNQ